LDRADRVDELIAVAQTAPLEGVVSWIKAHWNQTLKPDAPQAPHPVREIG
jgi:hypothetical protein